MAKSNYGQIKKYENEILAMKEAVTQNAELRKNWL